MKPLTFLFINLLTSKRRYENLVFSDTIDATAAIFALARSEAETEVSPSTLFTGNELAIELTDIKNTSARVAKLV
jgi:hypothetical protein